MADSKTTPITNPNPRVTEAGGLEWLPGETKQIDGATIRGSRWIAWALSVGVLVGTKADVLATAVDGLSKEDAATFAKGEIGALLASIA